MTVDVTHRLSAPGAGHGERLYGYRYGPGPLRVCQSVRVPANLEAVLTEVVALFSWWSLVRFAHVLSAVLWVGGQLTLSIVVRRAAVETLEDETRSTLFTTVGRSFGRMANFVLMPVLLGTGLALIYHRGVDIGALSVGSYGQILTVKIILAFVSFGLAALHGAMATRASAGASRAIGITGGLVSVVVVLLATALVP